MDRRIQRTQEALQTALLDLIQQMPYEQIQIQHITDHAQTARVTFYRHYSTKDELLLASLDSIYAQMKAALAGMTALQVLNIQEPSGDFLLFSFVERERRLVYRLMMGPLSGQIQLRVRHYIVEQVLHVLHKHPKMVGLPLDLIANHVATVILGNMLWWLADMEAAPNSPPTYNAAQMAALTHKMALYGAL